MPEQNKKDNYAEQQIAKDKEKDHKEETQKPQSILQKYGAILVLGLVLIFLIVKNNQGQPVLNFEQLLGAIALTFIAEYVLNLIYEKFNKRREVKYVPFNPEKEIPEIEERYQKTGKRVTIWAFTPEPKYGEGSTQPHTIHFDCFWQLNSGIFKQVSFAMIVLHRTFTSWEPNHRHIEDGERDWSGAMKFEQGVITRLYMPKPTIIRPIASFSKTEEEEEEDKEENK